MHRSEGLGNSPECIGEPARAMNMVPATQIKTERRKRSSLRCDRRRALRATAVAALAVVVGVVVLIVVDPFSGQASSGGGVSDNGAPTSLATVKRRSLSSQTQVSGTLGYAGTWTVNLPAGTAPAAVQQAQLAVATAQATLGTGQATLSADQQTLAQARAQLTADRLKERSDCAGGSPSGGGSGDGSSGGGGSGGRGSGAGSSGSDPCAAAAQAVTGDQAAVASAQQKVETDQGQLASARITLAGARQSLGVAEASASVYDATATYTKLPPLGKVIRRGQPLYASSGQPTLLLYGTEPVWRAFRPGMSPGRDIAELNANLRALGLGDTTGATYGTATKTAIDALQAAHGLPRTGVLALGSVAFEPAPVRVTTVTPTTGQAVQAGPVLTVSSTRHQVAIELDVAQEGQIKVGDKVTVTLPDNSTTPGVVDQVGKVATKPTSTDQGNSGPGGGSSTPTIEVDVRLVHATAAGSLDQAPVQVSITTASVQNALVVPVNALVALAGGGYAVEVVGAGGVHRLVAVQPRLFDDADGLVQVSGSGLTAGQRVVVPAS
jgi:Putative peptidoglycan binding domain